MIRMRTMLSGVLLASLVLTPTLFGAQEALHLPPNGAIRQDGANPPFNVAVPVDSVATLFSELYGPNGLIVDSLAVLPGGESHSAHFNSDFQSNFVQFGTAIASRLVSVPLPSPASGFTYEFDPSLGVFSRTTDSFGPILSERADTIGRGRVSFGFAYQRFAFDTIEDLNLHNVPAVFTHDGFNLRGGRDDVVTTENAIHARINQTTAFLTYGVTDSIDVSIGVPIINRRQPRRALLPREQRPAWRHPVVHGVRQRKRARGHHGSCQRYGEPSRSPWSRAWGRFADPNR